MSGDSHRTSAEIVAELRAAWNRRLYAWWRHYNEEYLREALRVPLILLSQSRTELGRWDADARRLRISAAHVERDPWLQVMETLRHEMAHQYVDEVLGARDEKAHGPAFRRACERLRCGLGTGGSGEPAASDAAEDQVRRRLKKVLSLTASPNENEAEAAVKKARRLLLKYNIDVVQLDQERSFSHRYLGAIKGRRASYELWLVQILQEFFFVETIWVESYRTLEDRAGTILQVCGTPANLEMAEYVHAYLTRLLERLWQDYKKAQGLQGNRERQRYYAGVLEGFYHKLQEQERTIRAEKALVWKGDGKLQEYYRYLNPRVQTSYGQGVTASAAYRDGLEDGRKVTIQRPVAASREGFGGYLKGE